MNQSNSVTAHYQRESLAEALIGRLAEHGIQRSAVTVEHLSAIDQMHMRGHAATLELIEALDIRKRMKVLDVGAGIGGPARVVATACGASVTALDLTPALCEANRELNRLVGLSRRITVVEGNATELPFEDGAFDRVLTVHASMNVERKRTMYREILRVLKPGGRFGFYDIVAGVAGHPDYPVPWATTQTSSHLESPSVMRALAEEVGFRTVQVRDLTNETRNQTLVQEAAAAARKAAGEPPPLQAGDILMGPTASEKARNLRRALKEGRIGLTMAVFEKPRAAGRRSAP